MLKPQAILAALVIFCLWIGAGLVHAYTNPGPAKAPPVKTTLVGLVGVSSDNQVYITTNWRSRSRASYRVTGSLKEEVAQHKGEVIKVEGLVSRTSPWSGTIEVEKVLEVVGPPQRR